MAGLVFGWEEWAAAPDLELPAVKVKIDTGARTSALHALEIEPFGPARTRRVRFLVHPSPDRPEAEAACEAPLLDRRPVRSSNGQAELRCFIRTRLRVGAVERTVELSLTDRGLMTYRMLLGRRALAAFGALVDPSRTGLQASPEPRLDLSFFARGSE